MRRNSQRKQLSISLVVTLIIMFSFVAGVMSAAGTYILLRKSGSDWMFELAMAIFLLLSAMSYARQLVGRSGSDDIAKTPL